ncbi:helix-turn-helix domain-containing protein [Facklamia miroungae]|uniref:Transcriptional regulator, contains XRE-family HTH domain n=1 Tax=Facklamia miroungae TaxID=120956 RepID=A0A1G7UAG5_9LACT|nr:helix-turn-helix transcriptional regulator [Facklamia miroungae]NKZ30032.1 helix-turn-helix transcriptional regulator [Facklamia miroungae]SDG44582.1 Transcriptional regulator, contains XRE-family HTH domain [Facklamia miroungae]
MTEIGISKVILRKRKEKNITQDELASYLMVSKAAVSKWETGQSHPDILLLPKIASYFNITIDELIGYEPNLSDSQIRKIIYNLMDEIATDSFENVLKTCKDLVNKYYSCFPLIYSIGLFLLNHIEFLEDRDSIKVHMEYIIRLFERVRKETEDFTLKNMATSLQSVCLLQIGKPDEVLELLPETEWLISNDSLIISSYIHKQEFEIAQEKLQIFLYKELFNLYNLLNQQMNTNQSNWKETANKIESLIDLFNIKELNKGLVITYYLSASKRYLESHDIENGSKYAERVLNELILMKETEFVLKGDDYFNRIDGWIDKNIIIGNKANRSNKMIVQSVLNIFCNDKIFEEISKNRNVKHLIKNLKKKCE